MGIDINSELKRMAIEFEIPEKDVASNFRQAVRSMWSDGIFKKDFYEKNAIEVVNTNPRSMKRFPKVKKYKCAICDNYFSAVDTELDHIVSENSMTALDHAEDFIKTIFFTSPKNLQILCKDKKSKAKDSKGYVTHFGCHGIKTYLERYNVTFEKAKSEKYIINICKFPVKTLDFLRENGIESIPKTKKDQHELVRSIVENKNV